MSQGTLANSTHYSQTSGSSTISRGPGECLCSSRTCLCTRKYALALYTALLVSNRQVASIVRFERRRPASSVPNAGPRFRQTALYRWRPSDRLYDQGSACGHSEAFPARAVAANLFTGTSPSLRPRADFISARRHHGLYGEGIVDIPEN